MKLADPLQTRTLRYPALTPILPSARLPLRTSGVSTLSRQVSEAETD
jgi:hypothetical protein